jgi:uncharacterized membrane protein
MKDKKVSLLFRKQLKDQLPVLQTEGLISPEQNKNIHQRYQLDALASEATSQLLMVIYLIGVFLIGIGVISFVAYHWHAMSKPIKIVLIFTAMLASHISGFYLWKVNGKYQKLGHALIFLGTLIFGANIGLMAQMFHIKGQWNGLFLPWAVGAIAVAYAVESVPNMVIGVITAFIWFVGQINLFGHHNDTVWWYPLVATTVFAAFTYLRRSTLIFTMMLFNLAISIPVYLASDKAEAFGVSTGMLAVGLLLVCSGLLLRNTSRYSVFVMPAMVIGIISTAIALYMCSFLEFADEIDDTFKFFTNDVPVIIICGVTLVASLIMVPLVFKQIWDNLALKIIAIPIVASLVLVAAEVFGDKVMIIAIANVIFLLLAASLVWAAGLLENRRLFWDGVLMAAMLVISRSLEYKTGLLIKAVVFISCGVTVIITGVMFEKYLKKRRISDE